MTDRTDFEAAMLKQAASEGYERPEFVLEKNLNGRYSTTWVHGAWIGWQAARASAGGQCDPTWDCPKCGIERSGPLQACMQEGCPPPPPLEPKP
jgi:hypothetical protein